MSNINEVVNEYLARLRELNCASISWADLNFPISYSVQSVKMLPAESDPGLASLTLRTSPSSSFGQLRLVHASKDVAEAVKAAVDKESGGLLVEEMNGVLLVSVAQEGDQKDVVGVIKVLCRVLERLIGCGWEVLATTEVSLNCELFTWMLKKSSTPLQQDVEVVAFTFTQPDVVEVITGNQELQSSFNNAIRQAVLNIEPQDDLKEEKKPEVETNGDDTGEKKDDLKEGKKPEDETSGDNTGEKKDDGKKENNPEDETSGDNTDKKKDYGQEEKKEEPLQDKKSGDVEQTEKDVADENLGVGENAQKKEDDVSEVTKVTEDKGDEKDESPQIQKSEDITRTPDDESKPIKVSSDNPESSSTLHLDARFQHSTDGRILRSKLILELCRLLFCRQWKLVSAAPASEGEPEVLFFCHDTRILPALGQKEAFAMLELQKPNFLRLHQTSDDVEKAVVALAGGQWLESKEAEVVTEGVKQFKLVGEPWAKRKTNDPIIMSAQALVAQLLLAMNKAELNLYAKVCLNREQLDQQTLLVFRQSNVAYKEALTLQLTGLNRLAVSGASEEDLEAIRHCFTSRWPYPLTHDEAKSDSSYHLFKVKRYPWAVSYGNKHLDKIMELIKAAAATRQIKIPDPKNMDAESAKSLLTFLLKDLGNLGWRLQTSADVCSSREVYVNAALPTRPSDAHALFLLR